MIEIRDAVETDDAVLVDLQKRCPMGSSLILQLDSSPSFFNRSKHQVDNYTVIAEEDGSVVGSESCAIMEKRVSGKMLKTAYTYNLMVDPNHRRRGNAILLGKRIEEIARSQNCDLSFGQITEGNIPSIKSQEKLGSRVIKDSTAYVLFVYKPHFAIQGDLRDGRRRGWLMEDDEHRAARVEKHRHEGSPVFHLIYGALFNTSGVRMPELRLLACNPETEEPG